MAAFEQDLPMRLPPAYRSLLLRYRFPAFEVGSVTDLRRRSKSGEGKVVRLQHEEVLVHDAIRVTETVAASFLKLLAWGSRPAGARAGR